MLKVRATVAGLVLFFSGAAAHAQLGPQGKHIDAAPIPADVSERIVNHLRQRAVVHPFIQRLQNDLNVTAALLDRLNAQADTALQDKDRMQVEGQLLRLQQLQGYFIQTSKENTKSVTVGSAQNKYPLSSMDAAANGRIAQGFKRITEALQQLVNSKSNNYKQILSNTMQTLAALHVTEKIEPDGGQSPLGATFKPKPSVTEKVSIKAPAYLATIREAESRKLASNGSFGPILDPLPPESLSCNNTVADLQPNVDVQINQEIQDLAKSLEYDPRKIYQYVYENIKFDSRWGSMRGALATLWAKEGGPTDQASLLIALLRASNIPARYVRGTIIVSDERGKKWFGTKTDIAAKWKMGVGAYPTYQAVVGGGIRLSHVWVTACVPYGNYRGSQADKSNYRWIPLDPSFKEYKYQNGIAVNVPFDYTTYLSKRTDELPQEFYARQVDAVIKTLDPNYTLADVPYLGSLIKKQWDILPLSLPYQVEQFNQWDPVTNATAEAAILPDSHRYITAVSVQGANYSISMPELAFKRLTVSFKAQASDATCQSLIDQWRRGQSPGVLGDALHPSALLGSCAVLPSIKLDGIEVATSATTTAFTATNIPVPQTLTLPEYGQIHSAARLINAADYVGVIAYGFQASDRYLTERVKNLTQTMRSVANPVDNLDATEGEFLYIAGLKYARYSRQSAIYFGELSGFSGFYQAYLGLTSSRSAVQYAFDQPMGLAAKALLVDVTTLSGPIKLDETTTNYTIVQTNGREFAWMVIHGASFYEHYLWQETARVDAVSTVRGQQWNNEQSGHTLCTLNYATFDADWANCVIDPAMTPYKANVRGTVAAAGYARVPSHFINYAVQGNPTPWSGLVWSYNNPTDWGMIIGGKFNGGYGAIYPADITNLYSNVVFSNYLSNYSPSSLTTVSSQIDVPYFLPTATLGTTSLSSFAGDPVNMLTGNLYHNERDLVIKGRGLPLVFERNYNSAQAKDGPLGFGWTHSFNHYLKMYGTENGRAKFGWVDGTGAERYFSTATQVSGDITPGTTLDNPPGSFQLATRKADGTYSVREKNGLIYVFESVTNPGSAATAGSEPRARLLSITDRNGNTLTLNYNTGCGNFLCSVTDGLNRSITFTYINSHLDTLADWSGRQIKYEYDGAGNLQRVKNTLAISGQQNPVVYTYYSGGSLDHAMQSYTLPRGNSMTFEYYMNGKVLRHTTNSGEANTFVYDDFRREARSINERGYTRTFFFDQYGNLDHLVKENGATHYYTYDTANQSNVFNRLSEKDPRGYTTQYQYDSSGNVTQTTLPSGNTVQYSYYTPFAQPGKVKDPRNNYSLFKYDAKGNLLESAALVNGVGAAVDPTTYIPTPTQLLARSLMTYDSYGNIATAQQIRDFVSSVGPTITYNYDTGHLNVTSIKRQGDKNGDGAIGAGEVDISPTMVYDNLGRLTSGLTPGWYVTGKIYDALDRITRATDANNQWRDYKYDANGNLLEQSLSASNNGSNQVLDRSSAMYDQSDRRIQTTDVAGNATRYQYDLAGNVTKVTDPDGYSIGFDYDAASRAVRAYDAEGNAISREFDIDGRLRKVTDPNGNNTSYVYYGPEKEGRLKTSTDAKSRSTSVDYDANGNLISLTDNLNRTTLTFYDELNRPARVVGATYTDHTPGSATNNQQLRPVTRNTYDGLGRLTKVEAGYTLDLTGQNTAADTALVAQMRYVWDDFGRKLSSTDANNKTTSYQYDSNSNLIQVIDAKGQSTTLAYNYGHQLNNRKDANGNRTSFTYNPLGQVLTAQNSVVTYSYAYDAAQRLASASDSRANKQTRYSYSPGGRLTKMNADDLPEIDYGYDPAGRLTSIWDSQGSFVAYQYDQGGRLLQKWLGNGTSAEYQWDSDDTLLQLKNRRYDFTSSNWQELSQHNYSYNGLGQKQSTTERVGLYAPPVVPEGFAYDHLGNRTQRTASGIDQRYVHDVTNQLKEIRDGLSGNALIGSLVYDANGNLTKKCQGASVTQTTTDCNGSDILQLTYDSSDQMIGATRGGTAESYAYDAYGRRIRKTSNGLTTHYRYQGDAILAEYNTTWASPSAYYLHGAGTDNPVVRYTKVNNQYVKTYLHQDGLGSVILSTDDTSALLGSQLFDVWGNQRTAQSAGSVPTYGYTGREPDATGLVYYRARYYDSSIARFVSRDPVEFAGGMNFYAYVGNDPISFNDPSGQFGNFAVGAFLGFGFDLAAQYVESRVSGQSFSYDYKRGIAATAVGAVTSGASAFVGGKVASLAVGQASKVAINATANAAIGTSGNVAQTAVVNKISGKNDSLKSAALWGAAGGAVGSLATDAYAAGKAVSNAKALSDSLSNVSTGERNLVLNIVEDAAANSSLKANAVTASSLFGNAVGNTSAFGGAIEETVSGGDGGGGGQNMNTFKQSTSTTSNGSDTTYTGAGLPKMK